MGLGTKIRTAVAAACMSGALVAAGTPAQAADAVAAFIERAGGLARDAA